MSGPNEHGVYSPSETVSLANPAPGWRGAAIASIDLLQLPDGWRFAVAAQLASRGRCGPITARCVAYATRNDALRAASDQLRRWLADSGDRLAPVAMRWLDTLIPDQLDLFGAAA